MSSTREDQARNVEASESQLVSSTRDDSALSVFNNNNLKCKVCENLFTTSGPQTPRLLLCGHSLCEGCLMKLLIDNHILCPFDRQSTYVPLGGVKDLNKNFALLEILDNFDSELNQRKESVSNSNGGSANGTEAIGSSSTVFRGDMNQSRALKCDENELHVATLYCLTCATNLCSSCADSIHSTKTLSRHKRIPVCDAPRQRPQCVLHPGHPVELVCLEPACQLATPNRLMQTTSTSVVSNILSMWPSSLPQSPQLPMMCYLCRDFSCHKGHKFNLLSKEAESVKGLLSNCVGLITDFNEDLTNYVRKLSTCLEHIEGTSSRTPSSGTNTSVLAVVNETGSGSSSAGGVQLRVRNRSIRGSALAARQQVHDYFEDLRHNLRRQEEVALSVVNTYVREKKCALQQSMESLTIILSQMASLQSDLMKQSSLSDVDLIIKRSEIAKLVDAARAQKNQFQELISNACINVTCDPSVPVTFTRDNRVHIGPKIEMRLVMLGLNNSGKTSILFKLKQNEFVSTMPTIGFNVETIEFKNLQFNIWDVGGDPKLRPLWKHYYLSTQALIFVVDSADQSRLGEAQSELSRLMVEKDLRNAILLVLANKQDKRNAMGIEVLTEELNLHKLCCGRKWHIQACDAQTAVGLEDGLDWLSRQLVWAGVVDVCQSRVTSSSSQNQSSSNQNSSIDNMAGASMNTNSTRGETTQYLTNPSNVTNSVPALFRCDSNNDVNQGAAQCMQTVTANMEQSSSRLPSCGDNLCHGVTMGTCCNTSCEMSDQLSPTNRKTNSNQCSTDYCYPLINSRGSSKQFPPSFTMGAHPRSVESINNSNQDGVSMVSSSNADFVPCRCHLCSQNHAQNDTNVTNPRPNSSQINFQTLSNPSHRNFSMSFSRNANNELDSSGNVSDDEFSSLSLINTNGTRVSMNPQNGFTFPRRL